MIRKLLTIVFSGISLLQITYSHAQTTVGMGLTTRRALPLDWLGYNGQSTTRNGVSWTEPNFLGKIPLLHPKVLRYPAGGIGNFWDWKRGWFIDAPYLPSQYINLPRLPDYLENFKIAMDSCHANAVFDLNMVTSTLQYQLAMLRHADSIGIPVKYVELGNEFYLSGDDPEAEEGVKFVDSIYPNAHTYGLVANIWVDSIHHYFPNAIVAIQGAFEKNANPKRREWNDSLLAVSNHHEDAWTFHSYYGAGWNDTTQTIAQLALETSSEIPNWMYQPYKAWDILQSTSLTAVPAGKEIWITEYNMTDHDRPVQGTWGHALYLGNLTLQYLQDNRIHFLNCHALDGTALHGQYFFSTNGYTFGDEIGEWVMPAGAPATTTAWALTASGNVMKMIGEAVDQRNYASPILFSPSPQIMTVEDYGVDTNYYDAIYGWLFNNISGSTAVIFNLSDSSYNLTTNVLFQNGGTYTLKYAPVLKPVGKNADVTIVNTSLPVTLILPPYSALKIVSDMVPTNPPSGMITVKGSNSICAGDSVQLDAGAGFISYLWSTGSKKRKIWVKYSGDYSVRAYVTSNGYAMQDTVHITVNQLPGSPNIIPQGQRAFCEGGSVVLDLQGNFDTVVTYFWNTGSIANAVIANTDGKYWVTITDTNGCKSVSDTEVITVYPSPHPEITASGPSSFCFNQSVTLSAPAGYNSYHWSNGLWGQSKVISDSGTYNVTVTDALGCVGQSSNSISVTVWKVEDPTVTVSGPMTFCNDSTYPCTLKTISGYNYQWKKAGIVIPGATKKTYRPDASANYKVTISDSHGCTKISDAKSIVVMSLPSAKISVTGGKNFCPGKLITLKAKVVVGYLYQWQLNGADILGAILPTYIVLSAGNYSYRAVDLNGCSSQSPVTLITANCRDEAGESSSTTVSKMSLYPNPAIDLIHIDAAFSSQNDGEATLEIRNVLGEMIYCSKENIVAGKCAASVTIDQHFSEGIYFVQIKSEAETLLNELVITGRNK